MTLPAVSTEPWTNRRGIALYFLGNPKSSKSLTDRGLSSLFKKEHTSTYGWANLFFNVGNLRLRFGHVTGSVALRLCIVRWHAPYSCEKRLARVLRFLVN